MGYSSFIDDMIKKQLMDLHCGYIGRVISTDGKTAKVQPLGLVKGRDSAAKVQAVISDVPVACRYKITAKRITYAVNSEGETKTETVAVPTEIAAGDLVACLCADRDISGARRGNNELPPAGHHSISDSIIVGIL